MPAANDDSGWQAFASEYIRFIDQGDPSRTLLLDAVMLKECGNVHGKLVLDVGAGEGRFSRMLAQRGARTTALDLFWPMVQSSPSSAISWRQCRHQVPRPLRVADRLGHGRYRRQLHRLGGCS